MCERLILLDSDLDTPTRDEILKHLKKSPPDKSPWPDGITNRIIMSITCRHVLSRVSEMAHGYYNGITLPNLPHSISAKINSSIFGVRVFVCSGVFPLCSYEQPFWHDLWYKSIMLIPSTGNTLTVRVSPAFAPENRPSFESEPENSPSVEPDKLTHH